MPRAAAAGVWLGLCCQLGCQPPEALVLLRPEPPTCRREPVSAVRVTLLGDFPPVMVSDGVNSQGTRLDLAGARSIAVEGLSARAVAALGWTGPLPPPEPGSELVVPMAYGAPDSLCQVGGLRVPRAFARLTYLGDGRALVTGGLGPEGATDTLERYSITTAEIFRALPLYEGSAIGHSATALPDGTLLVAGGAHPDEVNPGPAREAARLYRADGEPQGGLLLLGGGARALHAAARLADGQVWLSGGCTRVAPLSPGQVPGCAPGDVLATSVRYDLGGNFVGAPLLTQPRFGHQALPLPDGRVLVVGGMTVDALGSVVAAVQAEVIDPLGRAGAPLGTPIGRASGAAAVLPGGGVLWVEGSDPQPGGLLLPEGLLPMAPGTGRRFASLTALLDGSALLVGGQDNLGNIVGAVELYEGGRYRVLDDSLPRLGHAVLPLPDGTVLLAGGLMPGNIPSPLVSRFIHSLRVPDATPPAWPSSDPEEGRRWLAPRRPDRASFDGATLAVEGAGPGERPSELVLVAGVEWLGGELSADVSLRDGAAGAALVLAYQGEGRYHFLPFVAGQPLGLMRVAPGGSQTSPVCQGAETTLPQGPWRTRLRLRPPELSVTVNDREQLHCQVTLPRGAVGFGSLGGTAEFRGFSLVRGR